MSDSFSTGAIEGRFVCFTCRRMVLSAKRVLPHMGAYVCFDCEFSKKSTPVSEGDITNKSYAPWSELDLATINQYQVSDEYLPFICLNEHHLVGRPEGLVCPQCVGFKLPWVYLWILESRWKGRH